MAAPTLNSVWPSSGPPGTAITLAGAGFVDGARVACPALVTATLVIPEGTPPPAPYLTAAIPDDIVGPPSGTMVISIYVQNPDGVRSGIIPFTIEFPISDTEPLYSPTLQGYTSLLRVMAEVPGFKITSGGAINAETIHNWIGTVAQSVNGALIRRGLPLDSSLWPAAAPGTAQPTAAGVLEMVNRLGAAARLAAAIASQFTSGEWGIAKTLQREYEREINRLETGAYDKLFLARAATIEAGPQVFVGDQTDPETGDDTTAFKKEDVF